MKHDTITAAQSILLAAQDLSAAGRGEFTEWDLTIAAWNRDPNRFGLRGYEQDHPDHKRVMMEIMGQTKKDNPIRRGWMEKAGTNRYRITPLGVAEAERLTGRVGTTSTAKMRSPQAVYDAVEPYMSHPVFVSYSRDPEEPRTWLGASAFLSLSENTAVHLMDRLRRIQDAAAQALDWMSEEGQDTLQRGPVGGGRTFRRSDLEKLSQFVKVLEDRFAVQMSAIRKKPAR